MMLCLGSLLRSCSRRPRSAASAGARRGRTLLRPWRASDAFAVVEGLRRPRHSTVARTVDDRGRSSGVGGLVAGSLGSGARGRLAVASGAGLRRRDARARPEHRGRHRNRRSPRATALVPIQDIDDVSLDRSQAPGQPRVRIAVGTMPLLIVAKIAHRFVVTSATGGRSGGYALTACIV